MLVTPNFVAPAPPRAGAATTSLQILSGHSSASSSSSTSSQQELTQLRSMVTQLQSQKKMYMDMAHALKGNIRVFCRIKPDSGGGSSASTSSSGGGGERGHRDSRHSSSILASDADLSPASGGSNVSAGGANAIQAHVQQHLKMVSETQLEVTIPNQNTFGSVVDPRNYDVVRGEARRKSLLPGSSSTTHFFQGSPRNSAKFSSRGHHSAANATANNSSSATLGSAKSAAVISSSSAAAFANPDSSSRDPKLFFFDRLFDEHTTEKEVFSTVHEEIRASLEGHFVSLIAYGATGSGKTHTITNIVHHLGMELQKYVAEAESCGESVELELQLLEIYNEQIKDLLAESGGGSSSSSSSVIKIVNSNDCASSSSAGTNSFHRSNSGASSSSSHQSGTYAHPVKKLDLKSAASCVQGLKQLLQIARKHRATHATNVHDRSSRSHMVITLLIKRYKNYTPSVGGYEIAGGRELKLCGKLNLVDLAGSERVKKSEATGDRLKEAQHINRSLSALQDVIWAFERKIGHIPYRNSKLTHLLQDSLGANANQRTVLILTVNSSQTALQETLHTLQFGSRLNSVSFSMQMQSTKNTVEQNRLQAIVEENRDKLGAEVRRKEELVERNRDLEEQNGVLEREVMEKDAKLLALKGELAAIRERLSSFMGGGGGGLGAFSGGIGGALGGGVQIGTGSATSSASSTREKELERRLAASEEERAAQARELEKLRGNPRASPPGGGKFRPPPRGDKRAPGGGPPISSPNQPPSVAAHRHSSTQNFLRRSFVDATSCSPRSRGVASNKRATSLHYSPRDVGVGVASSASRAGGGTQTQRNGPPSASFAHVKAANRSPAAAQHRSPADSQGQRSPADTHTYTPSTNNPRSPERSRHKLNASRLSGAVSGVASANRISGNVVGGTISSEVPASRMSPRASSGALGGTSGGAVGAARGAAGARNSGQHGPAARSSSNTGPLLQIPPLLQPPQISGPATIAATASANMQMHQAAVNFVNPPPLAATATNSATSSASVVTGAGGAPGPSVTFAPSPNIMVNRRSSAAPSSSSGAAFQPNSYSSSCTQSNSSHNSTGSKTASHGHHSQHARTNANPHTPQQVPLSSQHNSIPHSNSISINPTSRSRSEQRYFIQKMNATQASEFCSKYSHLKDISHDDAEMIILSEPAVGCAAQGARGPGSNHRGGGNFSGAGSGFPHLGNHQNRQVNGGIPHNTSTNSLNGSGANVLDLTSMAGQNFLQRSESQVSVSSSGSDIKYRLQRTLIHRNSPLTLGSGGGSSATRGSVGPHPNTTRSTRAHR